VVIKFSKSFVPKLLRAGAANVEDVRIHVPTGKQVYVPPRPIHPSILNDLRAEIASMQAAGVIEPSRAKHNTPLIAVRKANGKLRVCADLRALNRVCEEFEWEFPRLDVALTNMTKAAIFSKIDLTSGFWQLPLHQDSRDYTTFRFDGSTWRFAVVPFGWKGAPAAFQAAMDTTLHDGTHQGFLTIYMDDILVHSSNASEHERHLQWTLATLDKTGFKLNPDKCSFGVPQVEFLGHIISADGIRPKPEKLDTIQNLKPARNVRELRSLLGTLGFYQTFITGYATRIRPLSSLLSTKTKFKWGPEQDASLISIKAAFSTLSPLTYMDPLNTKEFNLITDASLTAIGAQLLRVDKDGNQAVITNVSRSLSGAETRYSNTERELLAIVWALTRLEMIIAGKATTIQTDHAALIPILTGSPRKVSTPRVERLRMKLTRYLAADIYIEHIPGKENTADSLSRPNGQKVCSPGQAMPIAHRPQPPGKSDAVPKIIAPIKVGRRRHKVKKPPDAENGEPLPSALSTAPVDEPLLCTRTRKGKSTSMEPEPSAEMTPPTHVLQMLCLHTMTVLMRILK